MGSIQDEVIERHEAKLEAEIQARKEARWSRHYKLHNEQKSFEQYINIAEDLRSTNRLLEDIPLTLESRRILNRFLTRVEIYMFPHGE